MKITNKSKKLISFFNKFNCIPHTKQTKATDTIFKHFFSEMNEAMNFVSYTKKQMGHQAFYNLKLTKIYNPPIANIIIKIESKKGE
jgi:hypothetical protein